MSGFGVKVETLLNRVSKADLLHYADINEIPLSPMQPKKAMLVTIKNHFKNNPYWRADQEIRPQKYMRVFPPQSTFSQIDVSSLFESLPTTVASTSRRTSPEFTTYRLPSDYAYEKKYRLPAGSKEVRKERGLSKTEKTRERKLVLVDIDDLADIMGGVQLRLNEPRAPKSSMLQLKEHLQGSSMRR